MPSTEEYSSQVKSSQVKEIHISLIRHTIQINSIQLNSIKLSLDALCRTFQIFLRFTKSAGHVFGHLTQDDGKSQEQSLIHVQKYLIAYNHKLN